MFINMNLFLISQNNLISRDYEKRPYYSYVTHSPSSSLIHTVRVSASVLADIQQDFFHVKFAFSSFSKENKESRNTLQASTRYVQQPGKPWKKNLQMY